MTKALLAFGVRVRTLRACGLLALLSPVACGGSTAPSGGVGGADGGKGADATHCGAACEDTGTRPGIDTGVSEMDTGTTSATTCYQCQAISSTGSGACEPNASACQGSAECSALLACVNNCSDMSCINTCRSLNTGGITLYESFTDCLCGPPCTSLCASMCHYVGNDAGAACSQCQLTATMSGGACFSQASACNDDVSCVTLLDCLNGCATSDTACASQCQGASNDAGLSGVGAVDTCLCTPQACQSQCSSECGG